MLCLLQINLDNGEQVHAKLVSSYFDMLLKSSAERNEIQRDIYVNKMDLTIGTVMLPGADLYLIFSGTIVMLSLVILYTGYIKH